MARRAHTDQHPAVSLDEVVRVAEFRAALRAFLFESERHVRRCGLTPQRYQLLLTVMGAPDRSGTMTVTDVAQRMRLSRNAVSDLATRAEEAGLLRREPREGDARYVDLRASPEGERRVRRVIFEANEARAALLSALGARV